MIINPFKPKAPLENGDSPAFTGVTPLTVPRMLADARARFGPNVAYQQKAGGRWQRLTFEQMWREANEFAAGLIALGLQKGDRVALICENGLSWAVSYFGLSLAGGVAVPLYEELKRGEIEELVRRVDARFMIVSTKVLERLGDRPQGVRTLIVVGGTETRSGRNAHFMRRARPDVIPFEQIAGLATPESRAALEQRRVEPDDLASIVFTSGTTGGMKGVMLTHKNFMSNVDSARRTLQFDEKDRIVLVLPMHHAFPFVVFLIGFAAGGETTFENDLLRVRDRLEETRPTIFLGVPALFELMYRAIVQRMETEGRLELFERGLRVVDVAKRRTGVNLARLVFRELHQRLGGQLRFMICGGAALKPEVARDYFRLGLPLLQGWGLSEAAPVVAVQRWYPKRFFFSNYYEERLGTVGPAIEGVQVDLIDVPEKEIYVNLHGEGELVVRGDNVFAGYWQAEEEARAVKVGEWLRTGDLGRIDEEGNIWITGRSKYVIVLDSGEKVVPDELEERFGESELLQDVCVLGRRSRNKTQVGAVVFPNLEVARARLKGEAPSELSVRRLVQEELDSFARKLAPYKRVSEVILTDTPLPRTALLDMARGQLPESFTFDVQRWERSAQQALSLPDSDGATPPDEPPPAAGETA